MVCIAQCSAPECDPWATSVGTTPQRLGELAFGLPELLVLPFDGGIDFGLSRPGNMLFELADEPRLLGLAESSKPEIRPIPEMGKCHNVVGVDLLLLQRPDVLNDFLPWLSVDPVGFNNLEREAHAIVRRLYPGAFRWLLWSWRFLTRMNMPPLDTGPPPPIQA